MTDRTLGIDLGAETIKIVELRGTGDALRVHDRILVEHGKDPATTLAKLLTELDWTTVTSASSTGRMARMLALEKVPTKAALARGVAHAYPDHVPGTVVSIGSHGFSVLELRGGDHQVYRENSRCSQGTGNFLRQLVERFDLTVPQASALCADVADPAALSGRCPVILKTDMTHLANKGEDRSRILAGLYDAVCENVQALLRPRLSPRKVLLAGGVTRAARVRDNFRTFLAKRNMTLVEGEVDDALFLEALGAALVAAERELPVPAFESLIHAEHDASFEQVPSLRTALDDVRRMPPVQLADDGEARTVVLGFDIGSTGSKALAIDVETRAPAWEGYLNTLGDPVGAAQRLAAKFLEETGGRHEVRAVGATGSGREIVGSLMSSCYGPGAVFVLNEIAAHAEGALYFDGEVDTIFEIGGQDAKYIRLDGGRICDAAMNEACSAGTGSFIAEQGGKFKGVEDVVQMGQKALGADCGISLGQHCSVFMAEVIDEAVSVGVPEDSIVAGIYDSIIQNYLNRVKGNRSVGRRIFCQGMPFMADALAAAVARQTGRTVVVPPNPGTIGALGIALLTVKEIDTGAGTGLDLQQFLGASIDRKDTFICKSNRGCGEPGNKCRIDRLFTTVESKRHKFVWGGGCSLYDKGTHKRKLPDLTPDPFRERAALIKDVIEGVSRRRGRPVVALTEEFALKGMLPFFATFVHRLGFDLRISSGAGQKTLKRGIDEATVPFCAPMQLYLGAVAELLDDGDTPPSYLLAPRVREIPRQQGERHATTCPIVQASPDIVRKQAGADTPTKILTPHVDMATDNLGSQRFRDAVAELAQSLDAGDRWEDAYVAARHAQEQFDGALQAIGQRALDFAAEHDVIPVVVLGRAYTIHNTVLNSNVPTLLREQGALAIPVDCYPIAPDVPVFEDLYWGYSQLNLRAAHQIRRTDGIYAVFCSNYSCGPDSFNLHFFSYVMENKPFAIIETDGHSGDAGTKTRIEAFLYCVEGDRRLDQERRDTLERREFKAIEDDKISLEGVKQRNALLLVPRMGHAAPEVLVEVLRAEGIDAECLPMPTRDSLRIGRRYTSGKECVPLTITTGSLLERLEREVNSGREVAFFMPTGCGPCRFGVYNLLHKLIIEKAGWRERVRIVSPDDQDYFAGVSPDFRIRAFVGMTAADMLLAGLHDVRPVEREPGAAQEVFDRYYAELKQIMHAAPQSGVVTALGELPNGMYGARYLLRRAAEEFRRVKDFDKSVPTVSMVGEIYVRLDPFANDFVIDKLEKRGLRVLLAPFHEWLEYTTLGQIQRLQENCARDGDSMAGARFTHALETGTIGRLYDEMAGPLRWAARTTVEQALDAAAPYVDKKLSGEAVLTVGGPLHEHHEGAVDGVIIIGPHECMPNKVAEAQYAHIGEEHGVISLAVPLNGDPIDPEILDRFAFEVKQRHATKPSGTGPKHGRRRIRPGRVLSNPGEVVQELQGRLLFGALRMLRPFTNRRAS